jgi:uncharacterized MAPEG superfamily protein
MAFLLLATTLVQGSLVPLTQGLRWGLGSRDAPVEQSALQGRFARAVQNQVEAMLIYVPLMALVFVLEKTGPLTGIAAWLVIAGRTLFIPFYIFGVFGLRSAAYGTATVGIILTIAALLS